MVRALLYFFLFFSVQFAVAKPSELHWHWQDDFSNQDKQKLKAWTKKIHLALYAQYGDFPFPVHVYFHRARWASEPVPWANTDRRYQQAIHFHVDANASTSSFMDDWTAPHEFSHLLIPYLGKENRWFAEGFASYLQYQIMEGMGLINSQQKWARYKSHMKKAARNYRYPNLNFIQAAPLLTKDRNNPTLYWGSATYFMRVDYKLHIENKSLQQVVRAYLACCRNETRNFEHLISTLDTISKSTAFQDTVIEFEKDIGFPEYFNTWNAMKSLLK